MKKLLLTFLFLACVLLVGTKAFIALTTYQTMEALKTELEEDASISYKWISSDLSGAISIHNITVTPFPLKQTYGAKTLTLHFDHPMHLLNGLMDLKSGFWQGISAVSLDQAYTTTTGKGLISWLSQTYDQAFSVPLKPYGCLGKENFEAADWENIGINEFKANISLHQSVQNGLMHLDLSADLQELGEFHGELSLSQAPLPATIAGFSLASFNIHSVSIAHVEKGFLKRLSNYCTGKTQLSRTQFSELAAQSWKTSLADIGFITDRATDDLYGEYLAFGGKIKILLAPPSPIQLNKSAKLLDQFIDKPLGLSITLNNKAPLKPELYLDGKYFRPPVVTKVIEEAPMSAPNAKAFIKTEWDRLNQFINQQIRVTLTDGKVIEGTLIDSDKYRVNISQHISGGVFSTHPQRKDVSTIEIWR